MAESNRPLVGVFDDWTKADRAVSQELVPPKETGAMTPGMRPDDSSSSGIPVTGGGTPAATIDPATLEADLQHAQQVLSAKEQANEERASEQ